MRLPLFILMIFPLTAFCQRLLEESMIRISAPGREPVTMYAAEGCTHCYYYLPSSLRIAATNGTPEISLVIWNDEENLKPMGGILHFLVEWGLKAGYERDLLNLLRDTKDSLAVIMGPSSIHSAEGQTVISGNDKFTRILNASLSNSPSAPTTPGAKMALSFRFSAEQIDDLLYYVEYPGRTKTDLKVTYSYTVVKSSGVEQEIIRHLRLPFGEILKNIR